MGVTGSNPVSSKTFGREVTATWLEKLSPTLVAIHLRLTLRLCVKLISHAKA
jgi:hypothetical protein